MTRRIGPALAGGVAVVALLGGCGLGFGDEMMGSASASGLNAGPVVPEEPTGTDQGQALGTGAPTSGAVSSPSGGSTAPSSGSQTAAVTEIRDGTWDVGDSGQVQFKFSNGQLELLSADPAGGWQQEPPVTSANAIEVRFTQALGTTWTFRVQVSGPTMQITKAQTIAKAGDGSYAVGGAGSVSFLTSNSQLKLTNVAPENGWTVTNQQASATSIAVSLKHAQGTADFTATKSGADVKVATSQQLSGPVPKT